MPAITKLQVDWSKKNGLLESGLKTQQGPVLTMNNISQYQSGLYTCRASNGVGQPASQHINLTVLCKYLVYLVYYCYMVSLQTVRWCGPSWKRFTVGQASRLPSRVLLMLTRGQQCAGTETPYCWTVITTSYWRAGAASTLSSYLGNSSY